MKKIIKNKSKYEKLINYLKDLGSVAIAFSGGVDSTFLAYAAKEALGDKAVAITVDSPYIPRWELREAKVLAESIGIRHEKMVIEKIDKSIINNPPNRCYLCKKLIFKNIQKKADKLGLKYVVDGSNLDDTKDYRPGMVALKELGIKSPLLETKWIKDNIRETSEVVGLDTYNKPAYACLLTRLPYDNLITIDDLRKIEKSEVYLISIGFKAVRVRCHNDLSRIEIAREDRHKLFDEDLLDKISKTLKSYGFTYVTIEVAGYQMGSFNQKIGK